ncbi:MAG: hypothetical protein ACK504_02930 [Bacteroidota bacterium]
MNQMLLDHNKIKLGGHLIVFSYETNIDKIETLKNVICFNTSPLEKDLDWNKIETQQIWKERCLNNPSELFCYNFSGELKWKFEHDNVVGFGKITIESKQQEDFVTSEHYKNYIEKYKEMELLEVYARDFRYIVNANTGEIYDKMYSK